MYTQTYIYMCVFEWVIISYIIVIGKTRGLKTIRGVGGGKWVVWTLDSLNPPSRLAPVLSF